jgi:hypothetical protein
MWFCQKVDAESQYHVEGEPSAKFGLRCATSGSWTYRIIVRDNIQGRERLQTMRYDVESDHYD